MKAELKSKKDRKLKHGLACFGLAGAPCSAGFLNLDGRRDLYLYGSELVTWQTPPGIWSRKKQSHGVIQSLHTCGLVGLRDLHVLCLE